MFTFKGLKPQLKYNISLNEFFFEFLHIHMNEKTTIRHESHGSKWKNINIYPILIVFLYKSTPILVRCDYTHLQVFT